MKITLTINKKPTKAQLQKIFVMIAEGYHHGLQLRDKFQKVGWRIEYPNFVDAKGYSCNSFAYWKC